MLNTEIHLARRIFSGQRTTGRLSRPVSAIATFTVALSIAAMIIAVVVVTGFKNEVTRKITGFGAHFIVTNFDSNNSYESTPIDRDAIVFKEIAEDQGIRNIQFFATKPGLIKTENNIQGVVLKGVGPDYHWDFIGQSLIEGSLPVYTDTATSNQVLISSTVARLLNLKTGDRIKTFFIQENARMRLFEIVGIYNTGIREIDESFMLTDIRHIRKLNNWQANQVTGAEIVLKNFETYSDYFYSLNLHFANFFNEDGTKFQLIGIREKYPQIFDWLSLIDTNSLIIIILMLLVSMVNLISALLILVLEQTSFIGTVRAIGFPIYRLRRVYLIQSLLLILRGLTWGNAAALVLVFIQKYGRVIKLDETSYYLSTVPVEINWIHILGLNVLTIFTITLAMTLPTLLLSRISPSQVLRMN